MIAGNKHYKYLAYPFIHKSSPLISQHMNRYRENGAVGALLDEYEKALNELKTVIHDLSPAELIQVVDPETTDTNCRSIQTILGHVVSGGYNYAIEIRRWLGEACTFTTSTLLSSAEAYTRALTDMFAFNEQLFHDHPNLPLEVLDPQQKITVRWGQQYDPDQLLEHAIVHILRHRRQIERFKLKIRSMAG